MLRSTSGYPRAGRHGRSSLTRRGLLGAAAIVTGAGLADLFHKPRRSSGGANNAAAISKSTPKSGTTSSPATRASSTPSPSHSAAPPASSASGHPSGSVTHHDGHAAEHAHEHGKAGKQHGHAKHKKVEHVDLPPATVRVRHRPVYQVSDLIHDAPKHSLALTIDDGPDPEWTPKVLRLLDKYRTQASFCVVGVHADAYPKLVRDVVRAGHIVVNHSYTHIQPFNEQTEKRIVAEITRTQHAIERAAHVTPELFRAPGGAWNKFIFRAVAAYGLTPLDWDVDPRDWARPGTKAIERAMFRARPGEIVLCHDGGGDRSETIRALRKVLPRWRHKHYTTIPLIVPDSVKIRPTSPPATPATPPATPSITVSATPTASS
jgi:peptidoglycan/xylan/chitin deacetylase (PgdA/CDA1 family)